MFEDLSKEQVLCLLHRYSELAFGSKHRFDAELCECITRYTRESGDLIPWVQGSLMFRVYVE